MSDPIQTAQAAPMLPLGQPMPEERRGWAAWLGWKVIRFVTSVREVGAFALIALGVLVSKYGRSRRVIHPMILQQVARSGVALLPMATLLSTVLGLVVIGQTVDLTTRVGAHDLLGQVMVTVVVRELGPLIAAFIVLVRAGTANIIELATSRAFGEVEALEVLGIDPVHYLVVPRILGMATGVFCLTVYVILGALISGYVWAFIQEVPILPSEYFKQLALALNGLDFVLLGLKSSLLGVLIAVVTCYFGLARPLRMEDVSRATVQAVTLALVFCVLADAAFLILYLAL